MTENGVFLEESSHPNYLAMFVNEVNRMNTLDEVDPQVEEFVLSAFPDIDPSEVIGAELVDYDPPAPTTPSMVTNDYEEPDLLEL